MPSVISYLRADEPPTRETRIFTFGIILIAIGGTCAFFTLSIAYGLALGAILGEQLGFVASGGDAASTVLVPILLFTAAAIAFIWTGIGSVRLRRWCRPIVMCLSALAVAGGLLFLLDLALQWYFLHDSAPALVRPPAPGGPPRGIAGQSTGYAVVALTTYFVLGIIVPLVFFVAYRDREVERTLDEADPNLYWTDRSDLPTLAFALMMLHGAFMLLLLLPVVLTAPTTLVFGRALGPAPAAGFFLLGAVLCVLVARLVHMQSRFGPWLAIAIVLAAGGSVIMSANVQPPSPPPGFRWYDSFGSIGADDRTTSLILTIAVYTTPVVLFALRVLRLLQPGTALNAREAPEPMAMTPASADLPVPPLRVERPLLVERLRGERPLP